MPLPALKLTQSIALNTAAGAFVLGVATLMVRSSLMGETMPTCAERYSEGILFNLSGATGQPLTAVELQGRLNGQEYGLIDNMTVAPAHDSPEHLAMEVKLAKVEAAASPSAPASKPKPYGIGFEWHPASLTKARTGCLSYRVYLPKDFAFGDGGKLPGLLGSAPAKVQKSSTKSPTVMPAGLSASPAPTTTVFDTHFAWRKDATAAFMTHLNASTSLQLTPIDPNWLELKGGRWMSIEQEIMLGEPGTSDTTVRVFVDGKLVLTNQNLNLGQDPQTQISGVAFDVGYMNTEGGRTGAPNATEIKISPLALRWR